MLDEPERTCGAVLSIEVLLGGYLLGTQAAAASGHDADVGRDLSGTGGPLPGGVHHALLQGLASEAKPSGAEVFPGIGPRADVLKDNADAGFPSRKGDAEAS